MSPPEASYKVELYDAASDPVFALGAVRLGREYRRRRYAIAAMQQALSPTDGNVRIPGRDKFSDEVSRARMGLLRDKPVFSVGALVMEAGANTEHAVAHAIASRFSRPSNKSARSGSYDEVVLQAVCVHPNWMADWATARPGAGLSAVAATAVLSHFPGNIRIQDRDYNAVRVLLNEGFEVGGVLGRGSSRYSGDDVLPEDPQMFSVHTSPLDAPLELSDDATVDDALRAVRETFPDMPTFEVHSNIHNLV